MTARRKGTPAHRPADYDDNKFPPGSIVKVKGEPGWYKVLYIWKPDGSITCRRCAKDGRLTHPPSSRAFARDRCRPAPKPRKRNTAVRKVNA